LVSDSGQTKIGERKEGRLWVIDKDLALVLPPDRQTELLRHLSQTTEASSSSTMASETDFTKRKLWG
jgi:hypothetical protein